MWHRLNVKLSWRSPLRPAGHSHLYPLTVFMHFPPGHGSDKHSSLSSSQSSPRFPSGHKHRYLPLPAGKLMSGTHLPLFWHWHGSTLTWVKIRYKNNDTSTIICTTFLGFCWYVLHIMSEYFSHLSPLSSWFTISAPTSTVTLLWALHSSDRVKLTKWLDWPLLPTRATGTFQIRRPAGERVAPSGPLSRWKSRAEPSGSDAANWKTNFSPEKVLRSLSGLWKAGGSLTVQGERVNKSIRGFVL